MTISVANVRDFIVDGKVELPPNAVYVGRAVNRYRLKASPLANPYTIGMWNWSVNKFLDEGDVMERYRHLLPLLCIRSASGVKEELTRLADLARRGPLVLVCWCAPKACHADIIREVLEGMLQ